MAASSTGSANYPAILRAIPNDPALSSEFSDLLFLLARAGPVSSAALTFADEDVVSIVAAHGVQRATHRREDSLCDLALASGKTVVIADALSDPRVMDRRRVELESGVRFFAAVPLMDSLGRPVATLFAADTEPLTPAPPFLEALERTAGRISSRLQQRAEETRARRLVAERDPAVQEDTTDNRKAETALQASEAHYRRIRMQAIGRLAGGISHEFNNVLTTILGHSELALPEIPPGSPVRERIEVIRESALRAAALTQHLLAFSGKQVLSPRAVDLGTMLAKLRPRLASSAGPGITVDLVPPGREVWAKADPLQLEMTLLSLVAASRERMPGGGRFVIEVAPDAGGGLVPSGNWARIVVRDSGPVPSPDRIARLFEPFSDPSSLFTSTGLAFAVTYGFLTQSGGHALAAPSPDGGLEIRMVLPGSAAPNPAGRPSSSFGNLSGSGTVLVVEDEAPVRR
ncbi:MAG: GAF domain-containing protein, partial [Planctomycetes bacterium]|nr:GAF domain-containing protein [Planctomycetota bacterium]